MSIENAHASKRSDVLLGSVIIFGSSYNGYLLCDTVIVFISCQSLMPIIFQRNLNLRAYPKVVNQKAMPRLNAV